MFSHENNCVACVSFFHVKTNGWCEITDEISKSLRAK